MTVLNPSAIQLSHLNRADGSATYTHDGAGGGYTVVGAVNGPVEVQRRDELPEEATIEVTVRPATGVGGKPLFLPFIRSFSPNLRMTAPLRFEAKDGCSTGQRTDIFHDGYMLEGVGERHFEHIIQSTLRHVILVQTFPRSLIQVVLQVVQTPHADAALSGTTPVQHSFVSSFFGVFLAAWGETSGFQRQVVG